MESDRVHRFLNTTKTFILGWFWKDSCYWTEDLILVTSLHLPVNGKVVINQKNRYQKLTNKQNSSSDAHGNWKSSTLFKLHLLPIFNIRSIIAWKGISVSKTNDMKFICIFVSVISLAVFLVY